MRKFHFIILSALSVCLFSCQQEIEDVLNNPSGNNNNNNATSGLYQPLGSGSWWKYKDSASGNLTTTTATSVTKTFSGITYRALTSGAGDTSYMGVQGARYFVKLTGVSPNSGAPYDLILNYLNDTASVGYTWQNSAGQGNGFAATTTTTILQKGITMTVEGKTYNDVIHTFLEFKYDMLGTIFPYANYEFYVAKNVGIIKTRADIGPGAIFTGSSLVDHHIQ